MSLLRPLLLSAAALALSAGGALAASTGGPGAGRPSVPPAPAAEPGRLSQGIEDLVGSAGPIAESSPAAARGLGDGLQGLITGEGASGAPGAVPAPAGPETRAADARDAASLYFAKPAGDSVREAAEALHGVLPAPAAPARPSRFSARQRLLLLAVGGAALASALALAAHLLLR